MADITEVEYIWKNGEMIPWAEATTHVLSHSLHYGSGVFEGIRCYQNPETKKSYVFRLRDHMERLHRSCKIALIDLPYTVDELCDATVELIRKNNLPSCYIRPLVYRGYGVMGVDPTGASTDVAIAAWPWDSYLGADALEHGVSVGVSSWRQRSNNAIPPSMKSTASYMNSILAKLEAKEHGYAEAIMLNEAGLVEHDGLGVAVFFGFQLRQNGVHVGRRGLHRRRDGVVRTLTPRRHAHGHAVFERIGAQVGIPRPRGDGHVGGSAGGVDAHHAVAAVHERADVAGRQVVLADELDGGVAQLVNRVRQVDEGDFAAAMQALHVVAQTEDVALLRLRVLVAANALEHAGTVMQRVGQDMRGCLGPGDHLPVLPDVLHFGDVCHVRIPSCMGLGPQPDVRVSFLIRPLIVLQSAKVGARFRRKDRKRRAPRPDVSRETSVRGAQNGVRKRSVREGAYAVEPPRMPRWTSPPWPAGMPPPPMPRPPMPPDAVVDAMISAVEPPLTVPESV